MLRNRLENSLASKKHTQLSKKKKPLNPVVCFINPARPPIIIQGVAQQKLGQPKGGDGKKTGRSCWAGTPKARIALGQEEDTQKLYPECCSAVAF